MSVSFSYFKFQSLMLDKGTTTSIVTKYSLSNTKCSFFTKSATFLEEMIRLKNSSFQSYVFLKIPNRQQETMFKENIKYFIFLYFRITINSKFRIHRLVLIDCKTSFI